MLIGCYFHILHFNSAGTIKLLPKHPFNVEKSFYYEIILFSNSAISVCREHTVQRSAHGRRGAKQVLPAVVPWPLFISILLFLVVIAGSCFGNIMKTAHFPHLSCNVQ